MAEEPDRIRDDIELTRAQLAANVDRLADKTSPTRVAQRGWSTAKAKVRDVSDRVMGSAHDGGSTVKDKADSAMDTVKDKAGSAADTVKDKAGDVADTVRSAPAKVSRQTQGNPIAAGLIAFGAGLLAASLLPTTDLEKRAGREVRDRAEDLREPLSQATQGLREDLGDTAREAVASVRDTAKDAVQATKESAKSSAQDTTAQVKGNTKPVASSY